MSIVRQILQVVYTVHSEQHYALMFLSLRFFQFFLLFNDAWSENGHSASNATVILTSSYLLRQLLLHIIITFTITFSHLVLLLIFYTFLHRFVSLREERTCF